MHGALSIQVEAAWEAAARPFHIIQGFKIMADSIWEYSVWSKYLAVVSPVSPAVILFQVRASCIVST